MKARGNGSSLEARAVVLSRHLNEVKNTQPLRRVHKKRPTSVRTQARNQATSSAVMRTLSVVHSLVAAAASADAHPQKRLANGKPLTALETEAIA